MLLAAAFVSYAGPFTSKFRAQLIKEWIKFLTDKGAPMTAGISDPLKVLVDDATVASWVREGLPSDPTSVQNGTILTNSERWPLMMDPQLQVGSRHTCVGARQECSACYITTQEALSVPASKQLNAGCRLLLSKCSLLCSIAVSRVWLNTIYSCLSDTAETCCRA